MAASDAAPRGLLRRISFKGVILGGITDIVATNVAAFVVLIVVDMHIAMTVPKGLAHAAILAASKPALQSTTMMALGCLCSVLGGYVAARIAKHDLLLNGALSSFLCLSLGLYAIFFTHHEDIQVWKIILGEILSPSLGLAGGYLCLLQSRRVRTVPA